jgi:hypothetical protein
VDSGIRAAAKSIKFGYMKIKRITKKFCQKLKEKQMAKKKFWVVGLLGLLMACGLILSSCEENCGGGCKVTWTSSGEHLGGGACGANACASKCIVYRNWYTNKDGPGMNIIYRCDC